jgi:hypothetical protein
VARSRLAALSQIEIAVDPVSAQEKLVITDAAVRTILAFKVPDAALRTFVPAGWQSVSVSAGPSMDANLTVNFVQPIVARGPDGQAQDIVRVAALNFQAKQTGTEAIVAMVFAGFASNPSYVPGPYRAFRLAEATVERNDRIDSAGTSSVQESWQFRADNGDQIELQLRYVRALATNSKTEALVHSAKMPDFYRIYRVEQAIDVVRSTATAADRVQKFKFKAVGQPFARLFDGTEQLISITSIPLYSRQVFLPSAGRQ